jgi:hypothetical protein
MQAGAARAPQIEFDAILRAAQSVPEFQVETWEDVDRFDFRPKDGIAKIQSRHSKLELQVDMGSGLVVQSKVRRSDFIEDLHTGSFFSEFARFGVFFPSALGLAFLWFSGLILFWQPISRRRKRQGGKDQEGRDSGKRGKLELDPSLTTPEIPL